jgi:hypothetical protein
VTTGLAANNITLRRGLRRAALFAAETSVVTSRGISKINKRKNLGIAQRAESKMLQFPDGFKGAARKNAM